MSSESEASVLGRIQDLLTALGIKWMRNNVGAIRKGQRFIRYGLGVGSADLVCIVPPHGRWLAIEIKRPRGGKVADAQAKWLKEMTELGAVAGVCTTPEEAFALVEQARRVGA